METDLSIALFELVLAAVPEVPAATLPELLAILQTAAPHGATDWRTETTRRLLALGVVTAPHPRDDPLVNPARAAVDPRCADAGLAFARAVSAAERCDAGVLARVVTRHLTACPTDGPAWLRRLLEDEAAACLLVNALARPAADSGPDDNPALLRVLTHFPPDSAWPPDPFAAVCTLALLLRHPGQAHPFTALHQQLAAWPGWRDETSWPIRPAGGTLESLRRHLTERLALHLGCADRLLWPRAALPDALAALWPPLLSFCWTCPPRRPTP